MQLSDMLLQGLKVFEFVVALLALEFPILGVGYEVDFDVRGSVKLF